MKNIIADVVVIGAGTAGLAAFRAAKSHGRDVLLIDGGTLGTTCARVGCMPSKLLIAAADAVHATQHASAFGIHTVVTQIDGKAVMSRVQRERDRFVSFVLESTNKLMPDQLLRGWVRFIDANRIQVDEDTTVEARSFVIATGTSPVIPEPLKNLGKRILTTNEIFELPDLPESVAVLGTGIIGLELGQALHRLGVRVAVFGRNQSIAQLRDPAIREAAKQALSTELDLRLNTTILDAQLVHDGVVLHSREENGIERHTQYAYVLAATGRTPNIASLDLQKTGLRLDSHGVPLFDPYTMQCGESGVFIAGDVSQDRPLLHEAADQGRIAGDNAGRYPDIQQGLRHTPLGIVFTDPQIATVGTAFDKLKPGSFVIGEVSFEDQGRSRVMLQNRGLLHVYAEHRTGRFLGAEMAGPRAEHLAHLLAWACQSNMTIDQMLRLPFYHPVVEEGVRTALRDAKEKLMHGLPEIEHCTDCTPGM